MTREFVTKTKFINALALEHVAIHEKKREQGRECEMQLPYLRLEVEQVLMTNEQENKQNYLVMRGNRIPSDWLILETGFHNTFDGLAELHKVAVDIAISAAKKAASKIGEPVEIGMPSIAIFEPWFTT